MPGKSEFERLLSGGWKMQSVSRAGADGVNISGKDCTTEDWWDAEVPSTVLATLVKNGVYTDPYVGDHLLQIPTRQFEAPWWYRLEFELTEAQCERTVLLQLEGINYRARLWINGQQVAGPEELHGAFRRFQLNVSTFVECGANILAIELYPPQLGDFSIGFVDWNVDPPDRNMGLFREVKLRFVSGVSIESPVVSAQVNTTTLKEARLQPGAILVNHSDRGIHGVLHGRIGVLTFARKVELNAGERRSVAFNAEDYPVLRVMEPSLWWPYQMGQPHLHEIVFSFIVGEVVSDSRSIHFGIREVADYRTLGGHRGFKVNGRKVLIKGAGWTDDLLLQDTHKTLEAQLAYVRHMNLNCIRLEGFWGKDQRLYDLCDQYGILIMAGWSCQWEHEEYLGKPTHEKYGGAFNDRDIDLLASYWKDQLLWLRHHPSIFVWTVASDFLPHPALERKYLALFDQYDTTRPYLNSTGGVGSEQAIITDSEIVSEISGSSGVKMLGPYAYTPPVYWYTDKNLGGAYGFNTETCPGANVPPLESIRKMIPREHLWPIDDMWEIHCGKNNFRTLDRIQRAMDARFGPAGNTEDFARKAQLLNYELMRAMFEAFQANRDVATGVIQWMLNSAWPSMYWQLYDHYLMPNGAFYGAKKACETLHLLYHYGEHSVVLVNDTHAGRDGLQVDLRIFDVNSRLVYQHATAVDSRAASSTRVLFLPKLEGISTTYFLDLRWADEEEKLHGINFYWLSTRPDELDYQAKFADWPFYTPSKAYADFTALSRMPKVKPQVSIHLRHRGEQNQFTVRVDNPTDKIAFFTELKALELHTGTTVLPVFWEDNYISLIPGETRELQLSLPDRKELELQIVAHPF